MNTELIKKALKDIEAAGGTLLFTDNQETELKEGGPNVKRLTAADLENRQASPADDTWGRVGWTMGF